MPFSDLPLDELETYRYESPPPADLDRFWASRLAVADDAATRPVLRTFHRAYGDRVYDLTFTGAEGHPIRGWFLRAPVDRAPCLIVFHGYGGGRGQPLATLGYTALGLNVLVMDNRAQGASWTTGATPDPAPGTGPELPGVMTRGLAAPETHFYSRLYVDAARAVSVAAELPGVDPERIATFGRSQGGALAIAAAALRGSAVRFALADVPFMCALRRSIEIAGSGPYLELQRYFAQHVDVVERSLDILSHFDVVHLAEWLEQPVVVAAGLMDDTCPPSGMFALRNAQKDLVQLDAYRFATHDLVEAHELRRLEVLRETLH